MQDGLTVGDIAKHTTLSVAAVMCALDWGKASGFLESDIEQGD